MTQQRSFKKLVRERMSQTGERYTAARAQILAQRGTPSSPSSTGPVPIDTFPGILAGYDRFGGVQGDTAALSNLLRHARVMSPITGAAYGEAMVNGLCGGPGFLYAAFEYKGLPAPILSLALRSRSMPETYLAEGLPRLGLRFRKSETSSPKAARKALDDALSAGRGALCLMGMRWVGIVGRHGDDVWLDDRGPRPVRMSADALEKARAASKQGKNRLITVEGVDPKHDARKALQGAIADTARTYVKPAVPKSFWVNCGFAGLEKWQRMLVDVKDKKAWPTLFAEKHRAFAGLVRAYECIEHEATAPAGGRAFYADFLDEAAGILDRPSLKRAAAKYREAGGAWAEISSMIAACGDTAVREACELTDRRLELKDADGEQALTECEAMLGRQQTLGPECRITAPAALALYATMAEVVGRIAHIEKEAVGLLNA